MLGAPVVSSGERNFLKINRAQFQDALFSLVAGLNLTQIQQIQKIRFSDLMLGAPVVSSGERNFWKISCAQFQDALFSLVAGLNLTQIQQIQKISFFSDRLLFSPFFYFFLLADKWHLSAEIQGIRGDVLDSSMVRAARPGHVCALRHIKLPRVFFQREKYDVWRECVIKDRNE